MKVILFLLLFISSVFAQTKFFIPTPIESSNGRPIQNADVDLYQSGVKIADLVWLNAGRYYYTDTTVVSPGVYDIFVDGISWQTNTYINYGADVSVTIGAQVNDSLAVLGKYNVLQFAAVANDGTSQSTEIQAAIDDANVFHLTIGYSLADTFLIRQPLTLKSNLTLEINGVLKTMGSTAGGDSTTLVVDADSGDLFIRVTDVTIFEVGDQITLVDSVNGLRAGGQTAQTYAGQTRRVGSGADIASISGDTLHLTHTLIYNCQVDSNARVGVQNGMIYGFDIDNIRIFGRGVLDGNKANVFQATPRELQTASANGDAGVITRNHQDNTNGTVMSFYGCRNITLEDITVKNAVNLNIHFKHCNWTWMNGISSLAAYDKNVILWFSRYGWLDNIYSANAEYEDGVIFYSNDTSMVLSNSVIENNNRSGLTIGGNAQWIRSDNNVYLNNGANIRANGGNALSSVNDICFGGGIIQKLPAGNDDLFSSIYIHSVDDWRFTNLIVDSSYGHAGIDIQGDSENISFIGGKVRNTKTGTGIRLRRLGVGDKPDNILFDGMEVTGHDIGINVGTNSDNILSRPFS